MALRTADDRTRSAALAGGALLVVVLAACVAERTPAPPKVAAGLPHEGFGLDSNPDEGLKLVYGVEGTDNVTLMLECQPGSRKIAVIDFDHPDAQRGQALTLASGQTRSVLEPTLETNEEDGGMIVTGHVTPDLPALDGFRRSGRIAVSVGSKGYMLSATTTERLKIERFFSGCDRR
ncbi:MAG TPA: hypothetical protein VGM25_02890 [Caulobacteraceae bacterium]|jgi:hypothetical protein